jgi:hypothetical protein
MHWGAHANAFVRRGADRRRRADRDRQSPNWRALTPLLGAALAASAVWGMAAGGVVFALAWIVLGAALLKRPPL